MTMLPPTIKEQFRAESVGSINITASGGTTGEWVDTYDEALNAGIAQVESKAWGGFEIRKVYIKA